MYQPHAQERASRIGRREMDAVRARLAALVEHSGEAVVAVDPGLLVTSFNPAATRLFGATAEEAIGRPLSAILGTTDERIARGLDGEVLRFDAAPPLGAPCVAVTVAPLRGGEGEIVGAGALSRDVTPERFSARCTAVLSDSVDRVGAVAALNRLAVPELADLCVLFSYDPERREEHLEHVAAADPAIEAALRGVAEQAVPGRDESVAARVLATGLPGLLDPVPEEINGLWKAVWPQLRDELAPLRACAAIVLPLRAGQEIAGFLYLISLTPDRRHEDGSLQLASDLPESLAQTLERGRLYETAVEARERFRAAFA